MLSAFYGSFPKGKLVNGDQETLLNLHFEQIDPEFMVRVTNLKQEK